jgi:predicted AAA+ superfamily ATPase
MESRPLDDWNPWWVEGGVPDHLKGLPRDILKDVDQWMEVRHILTLVGVRRSGKSTLMYQLIDGLLGEGVPVENVLMVNMEDPRFDGDTVGDILDSYRQKMDPAGRMYIFLDEVQLSAGWERWVYSEYERRLDVKFIVTGSSSSVVRSELATLLTGRTFEFDVRPLSFNEFLRFKGVDIGQKPHVHRRDVIIHELDDYLERGGFPEAVLMEGISPVATLQGYLDAILYRDVVFRHGVDAEKLTRLVTYVLSNIGTLQSNNALAKACDMSSDTVGTYLWYLEQAMLLVPVGPLTFKTKPKTRMQLPTKYYCVDTGLRNAVARGVSTDQGHLAENLVCLEMVRRGERPKYWRNKGEVDFVTGRRPGSLSPVNVCYSDDMPPREYSGLASFGRHVPRPRGEPLLLTRSKGGDAKGVRHLPLWRWLLEEPPVEGEPSR